MGQDNLYWENISAKTQIPELVVHPDHTQIFMFSAITWNRHQIHYNKDAALREGLPDIVVQRGLIGNFFARLITNWIADNAELRKLTWKVTRSALPGRDIICRAIIKKRKDSEDEKYLICEITAFNKSKELIASGEAKIVFNVNSAPN